VKLGDVTVASFAGEALTIPWVQQLVPRELRATSTDARRRTERTGHLRDGEIEARSI
jgi:hypothetical protein